MRTPNIKIPAEAAAENNIFFLLSFLLSSLTLLSKIFISVLLSLQFWIFLDTFFSISLERYFGRILFLTDEIIFFTIVFKHQNYKFSTFYDERYTANVTRTNKEKTKIKMFFLFSLF